MDNIIQKIAFIVVGAVLLFISYVLWSPGAFGLCGEVIKGPHWFFGELYWCDIGALSVHLKATLLNIGLIILFFFTLAMFLNQRQFSVFRNSFLIGLLVTILFIYFFPDFDVAFGTTYDVVSREKSGSYALAIYSAAIYVYALIKERVQKAN